MSELSTSPSRLSAALDGRYRIERELGAGGMATVYLAEDIRHRRQVAIKVLRADLSATLGTERFLREIETTANLRHPHILPLYDSGDADGQLFYVMPLVEGESLGDRLEREKQLSVEDALRITREVADALFHAHARGVVHRDVKPDNILLEGGHAVVADFGIARAVREAGANSLTQTGTSIGTPTYMSPEQAAGEKEIDGRSDEYSLACVLFEMLAGQPPFTGTTVASLIYQHMASDAPPISVMRATVPAHVSAALSRALAKSPSDRFADVAQFAAALGPEGSAETSTRVVAARSRSRVPTWAIAAAAVIVMVVLAAFAWTRIGRAARGNASIAVLPFADLSPDHANAYLGDGIAEALINALANVSGLQVAARTSAFSFRNKAEDVREIGRQLGVAAVLEGSVQRSGDKLRVTAHLINTKDGLDAWSQSFDRPATDIFAVQDEVSRAVVSALQVKLATRSDSLGMVGGTHNAEAYDAYLLGRHAWGKRTAADLVAASKYFEAAIRADSNYAQAWSGLADSYVLFVPAEFNVPGINQDSILTLAERAARRAIGLAPQLGEAYTSLGAVMKHRFKWQEASDAYQRGVALSPRYPSAHLFYGYNLTVQNRPAAAIREFEVARQLDPLSHLIVASAGGGYVTVDSFIAAAPLLQRAEALTPNVQYALSTELVSEAVQGHFEAAAALYRRFGRATGMDSAVVGDVERGLRDPVRRSATVTGMMHTDAPNIVIALLRGMHRDDDAIAVVAGLTNDPRREHINAVGLFLALGPKLRANPKMQAALVQLGYPNPANGEAAR
jgi:serine/threonine-protein kinase